MKSRLLSDLDERISSIDGTIEADCLRGNMALQLLRLGRADGATSILTALHAKYDSRPDVRISCWIHLVEAVSTLYTNATTAAHDRLKRCSALARASADQDMQALASAWLAHISYGSYDGAAMQGHIGDALSNASPSNHQALSRAKLIGAVALHLSGRYDLARTWYSEVRRHAAAEGDDATVSALMHNLACMSVATLRQSILDPFGAELANSGAPSALHEANATASFDELVGASALSAWVPILQAQALSLQGHYGEALAIYEANLPDARDQGLDRVMSYMYADLAWCRAKVGQATEARTDAIAAEKLLDTNVLIDDWAATYSRLAQIYQELAAPEVASQHLRRATDAWKEFHEFQASVVQRLAPLVGAGA